MELSSSFKSSLRFFVYYYSNGTLPYLVKDGNLLSNIDYLESLKDQPSNVELTFAIYANNIKMDEDGKVLNQNHAMNRAAQFIISACNDTGIPYEVVPEFEDWELELH